MGIGRDAVLHAFVELAGQADAAPLGHGLGHLLLVELAVIHMFLVGIDTGDKGFMHLLHELGEEDSLHFRADLGQILLLDFRVLGLILQGIEGS